MHTQKLKTFVVVFDLGRGRRHGFEQVAFLYLVVEDHYTHFFR